PMTAIAVLQLVEQGRMDLDAEIQTYVPYFPKKRWPVTARQLLGHLSGISHYQNPELELHIKEPKSTREAIAIFENFNLIAEPGTRYRYSSYGYNLLGAAIESASGMSFGDYMKKHLWEPLGMKDTRMDDPRAIIPNRVRGYGLGPDGKLQNSEYIDISSRFAAGGTRSTVPDLLKFARGVMDNKLLSPESTELMLTSMAHRDGLHTDYGMGWSVSPANGRFRFGHSGGQSETRTRLMIFPKESFAIALATNFEDIPDVNAFIEMIYETVFDEPWDLPVYLQDASAKLVYRAMGITFDFGLAYYQWHQQPMSEDPEEIQKAFAEFTSMVDPEQIQNHREEVETKLRGGRHPAQGSPLVILGSAMAAQLAKAHGPAHLESYHKGGALSFFHDYVHRKDNKASEGPQFSKQFAERVERWEHSWRDASFPWHLEITQSTDLNQLGAELKKSFSGAEIVPSFVDSFQSATTSCVLRQDLARGVQISRLSAELYPASATPKADIAVLHVLQGNQDQAREMLKQAVASPFDTEDAGAGRLNTLAYSLAGIGLHDSAIDLLKITIEQYPQEANLYDSVGEMYLKKGEKKTAIEWYRQALKVDPKFENAKQVLKRIDPAKP
ncbi:MAG: serine hydrolase, partial [Planctomycetota bacterium]